MLTEEELQQYHDDGVVMLKPAIAPNWMAMVKAGIEEARNNSSALGKFMSRKVEGFQMDIFLWSRIDILRDLIYYGPFAHLASGSEFLAYSWRADLPLLDSLRSGEPRE